jgi:hypothetical protein
VHRARNAPRTFQSWLRNRSCVIPASSAIFLKQGTARQDLADGVADVQVKTIEFLETHDAPLDLGGWKKLCSGIADAHGKDALRRRYRRAPYHADLCEEPDAYADDHKERLWDPVDEARLLDLLVTHLRAAEIPEVSFAILEGEATGTAHVELAAELGITRWAVERRLASMQQDLRTRVAASGLEELILRLSRTRE